MVKNNESKEYEERIFKQVRDLDHRLEAAIDENNTALVASYVIELEGLLGKASILWKNTATILADFRAMSQIYLRQDKHSLLLFLKDCTHRLLMIIDGKENLIKDTKEGTKIIMDTKEDLKPEIKRLLVTIIEMSVIEQKHKILTTVEGLRLKALIREQDKEKMTEYLQELKEKGFLDQWIITGPGFNILLSDKIPLLDVETSKRESIEDNVIRRAILFRLFEEGRKSDYLVMAQVALTPLSTILEPKLTKISTNATYLQSIDLIKKAMAMDGGLFTSHITTAGMELAKNTEAVFSRFPTIGLTKEQKEVKEKNKSIVNKVFVVHGQDDAMKEAVARVLETLGLEAIILHERPDKGRTIIEKFTDYADVCFAVILMSPDDLAYPKNAVPATAKFRARQNVILELGYFIGKLGRENVFTLYKEETNFEMPSDYSGVIYTPYDAKGQWKFEMVQELQACGIDVDANKLMKK
jgi:predicted nucleotide-binding protein